MLKARVHAGVRSGLAFFRDRRGREVDLLVENSGALVAIETKSGQTVADDMFAGLVALAGLLERGRRAPSLRQVVVYAGATRQERTSGTVLPWFGIDSYDWTGS